MRTIVLYRVLITGVRGSRQMNGGDAQKRVHLKAKKICKNKFFIRRQTLTKLNYSF